MMKKMLIGAQMLLLLSVPAGMLLAQTATLRGTVTDGLDRSALPGANVVLSHPGTGQLVSGSATDAAGRYVISGISPASYQVTFSYVGYRDFQTTVTLSPGEDRTLNATLAATGVDLNPVVVTASRQEEMALHAPASLSVIDAREIEREAAPSTEMVLRNVPGVDMATTGLDRHEVVLRGFNQAFSGSAHVLVDYRKGSVASLGVNAYSMMPLSNLDVERIELVRGPGSALYGAGADHGVIHFISKDPFTSPGTSLSLGGGERSVLQGVVRHAGVVNDRIGYKINGQYMQGQDWRLDATDPLDLRQIQEYHSTRDRQYDVSRANLNGMVAYRVRPGTSVIANAGFATSQSVFLSGIGTLQSDGFGYSYGQVRLNAGDFFAQMYLNRNQAGNSFVYAGPLEGQIIDRSWLFSTQAQYGLHLGPRQRFIIGADFDRTNPSSEGTIFGRYDSEVIDELGTYVQSETALTPMFDLTLAVRGDYNNIAEQLQLSPRAALVFKPSPQHSVRGTYNRAFSSPGSTQWFLDIEALRQPITPNHALVVRARGGAHGYTFERNAAFAGIAGTDLVAYSLNPAAWGQAQPAGLTLAPVYAQVYAQLAAALMDPNAPLPSPISMMSMEQRAGLAFLLHPDRTAVQGFSRGRLTFDPASGVAIQDVVDIEPLRQRTSQTFELGYKGLIQNRFLFSVDLYHSTAENFIGPLLMTSPMVMVPTLISDLQTAMTAGIDANAQLKGALQQMGMTPAQASALIAALASPGLQPVVSSPIASVLPLAPGEGPAPGELLMTYRNYGRIQLWGSDVSMQAIVSDALSLFGSFSYVSTDFFDSEAVGEPGSGLFVSLNAPQFKVKGGFDYQRPLGIGFNGSARYHEGFPVASGPYVGGLPAPYGTGQGGVEPALILDAGIGYDLSEYFPGLRLNVVSYNLLNNRHRQFIGAPQIGRMTVANLVYTL